MHIFVSKPNALNPQQAEFWEAIKVLLTQKGLEYHCLGDTDFPNKAPLTAVKKLLRKCQGAIVLGLRQTHVISGVKKGGTPSQFELSNAYLGTEWNHIEAGMAYMNDLPLLIIRENGVQGGVFDAGNTDLFIHQISLEPDQNISAWLLSNKFQHPFDEWIEEMKNQREEGH